MDRQPKDRLCETGYSRLTPAIFSDCVIKQPQSTTNNIDHTREYSSHHKIIASTFYSVSCCTCECIIPAEQDPGLSTPVYSLFRIHTALYIEFRFMYTSLCTSYYTTVSLMFLKRDNFALSYHALLV